MSLFQNKNLKLNLISEESIDLERYIQDLTEKNLETILGFELVKSEFCIQNFSIDTLAFDRERKAFVLIEYKKGQSFSVIDQGYAYLAVVLAHKADLVLEYNERKNTNLGRNDVDWSQTKVIFIAPSFTSFQQGAIAFKDLPIELWEIKKFKNDLVLYNQIKPIGGTESIKTVSKSKIVKEVSEKVKPYSIEEHLRIVSTPKTRKLFEIIQEEIKALNDEIEVRPFKMSINYRINRKQFVALGVQQNDVRVYLVVDEKNFEDPQKKTKDISNIGKVTAGNRDFHVENEGDIKYAMKLIVQAYNFAEKK